jgi:uncharacterized membrane protein YbhN (UPF0104 family)
LKFLAARRRPNLAKDSFTRKMGSMIDRLIDRRRLFLIGLLGLASGALLLGLGGGQAALTALANANWGLVALAVLVHYSSFALRGHRWQKLLAVAGYHFPYLYTTTLLLAGWFTSALLPARAGDLLRAGVLRLGSERYASVPLAGGLSSIVLERVLDILAILLLGAAFGFALLRDRLPPWLLGSYAVGIGLLMAFGAGLLLAPPLLGGLRKLPWLAQQTLWQKGMDFLAQFVTGLRTLFQRPAAAALVIGESLLIWLGDALLVWLAALSLGAPLPLPAAAFVALTVDVLAAVPLTPGGVGQIDAAYAALLALLALPAAYVGALVLLVRLISYWSFLAFSGVVTLVAGFGSLLPRALAVSTGTQTASPAPAAQDGQAGTPALQ